MARNAREQNAGGRGETHLAGKRKVSLGVALGVVATVLVGLAVWLTVVYTGAYNVAATDPHADFVRWTLDTTLQRSVSSRADEVPVPDGVSAELVRAGAETYGTTCSQCHGAPGVERASWATNMRPEPPELAHAATRWELREVFWIAKNGIKMSGMPAFGPEHTDEALWGVAAFVKQLPGMTAEEYQAATGGSRGGSSDTSD